MVVSTDPTTMRKNVVLRNMLSYNFSNNTGSATHLQSESFKCDQWSSSQVADWIRGLDDATSVYANNFIEQEIDGSKLLNFDDYALRKIGVMKSAVRTKIMNAVGLLSYFVFAINNDNLQRAAMNVTVSTTNMLNTISIATTVINNPLQSSRVFEALSAVLCAITDVYSNVRRLMCWLDRSPFDDKAEFISLREKISAFIKEMVDCVNNPNNPKFFSVPQLLVERGRRINEVCTKIVRMNDPSILYTTYLERVTIRKNAPCRWGFDVNCMFTGIGMVTHVNLETPAGISGKIEAGDEILEVNGEAVVGWTLANLMCAINNDAFVSSELGTRELILLLNKRPREMWATLSHLSGSGSVPPATPLTPSRPMTLFESLDERMKMMLDFKMKIQPDLLVRNNENNLLLLARARSFSFNVSISSPLESYERCAIPTSRCVSLFVSNNARRQVSRRASVWSESPPAMLRSPLDGLHYQMESNAWLLLLASWGNGKQKTAGGFFGRSGPLTPRLKEFGDVIKEEDGDYSSSDETKRPLRTLDIDYSNVETINDHEVDRLKAHFRLQVPSIHDNDWNQPIREITGLRIAVKRTHLESGSNISIIDSPLSTIHAKLTRFFYGDPSPSHSVASSGGGHSATASVALPETISTSVSSEKLVVDGNYRAPLAGRIEQYLFGGGGSSSSSVNSPLPTTPGVEKFGLPRRIPAPISASSIVNFNGANGPKTPAEKLVTSSSQGCIFQSTPMTPTGAAGSPLAGATTPDVTVSFSADLPIKTVTKNSRGAKLAPLAEPDELGELYSSSSRDGTVEAKFNYYIHLQDMASIPCYKHDQKTYESVVRRQKLLLLDGRTKFLTRNERGSQWIKCWMVLKDDILYVYQNENANEADVVINVPYFYLTMSTDLKTSKKHVFALCWNLETVNFALYSSEELKRWLKYLKPLTRKSSGSTLLSTPVVTHSLDSDYGDEERMNAIFVRLSPNVSADDYGGAASGSTGPPTPSPLFTKTMTIPPPLSPISVASSSSSGALAFTTPLPSPRSSNFTFLPTKIFSKVNRQGSLRSQNVITSKGLPNINSSPNAMVSSFSSTGIAHTSNTATANLKVDTFCGANDTLISVVEDDVPRSGSNLPVSISISSSSPPLPQLTLAAASYTVAQCPTSAIPYVTAPTAAVSVPSVSIDIKKQESSAVDNSKFTSK